MPGSRQPPVRLAVADAAALRLVAPAFGQPRDAAPRCAARAVETPYTAPEKTAAPRRAGRAVVRR